jgi:diguanylate cyclase (GGDEF)-like protein
MAPWWLTGWLLAFTMLGTLGLATLWLQWRLRKLLRHNVVLERRVEVTAQSLATAHQALEQASVMDVQTGLHNLRFLEENLSADAMLARRAFQDMLAAGRDPLAAREDILLFVLDLDDFGQVNASWGRPAGDAVLTQLAQALMRMSRKTDFRVRLEGARLLLVARRARRVGATTVARNLLDGVRDLTFQLPSGDIIRKRVSIGFTALPLHPGEPGLGTWQEGLELAVRCLEAAKATGRDRWVGAFLKGDPAVFAGAWDLDRWVGAFLKGDPAVFAGAWDLDRILDRGLVELQCSEPSFRWPVPQVLDAYRDSRKPGAPRD